MKFDTAFFTATTPTPQARRVVATRSQVAA